MLAAALAAVSRGSYVIGRANQWGIAYRLAVLVASKRSAIERRHNEQPSTDQQGERDTADDRENAMPAIGGLGPGNGILRRCDTHPEVTHTSNTSTPTHI
jgi:hypothetical protein